METQCPSLARPREMCGGQSGTRTRFLRGLQFPSVSIILTLLHMHVFNTLTRVPLSCERLAGKDLQRK